MVVIKTGEFKKCLWYNLNWKKENIKNVIDAFISTHSMDKVGGL